MFELTKGAVLKVGGDDDDLFDEFHQAVINGEAIKDSSVSWCFASSGRMRLTVDSDEGINLVLDTPLEEVAKACHTVNLYFLRFAWSPDPRETSLVSRTKEDSISHLRVGLGISARESVRPYSVAEYLDALHEALDASDVGSKVLKVRDLDGQLEHSEWSLMDINRDELGFLELPLARDKGDLPVGEHLDEWEDRLAPVFHAVDERLNSKVRSRSVIAFFEFPDDLRTPCEQYLSYFAQFLRDLGIDATTDLSQRTRGTLFTITPTSDREALEKIREALDTYLAVPGAILPEVGVKSDVAVQQLVANVYHLKSQLSLAHALIGVKDSTIQAKDATIYSLEASLRYKELPPPRAREASEQRRASKEVPVLGDTVILTEAQFKGFKLNVPELYRKLRRRLLGPENGEQ